MIAKPWMLMRAWEPAPWRVARQCMAFSRRGGVLVWLFLLCAHPLQGAEAVPDFQTRLARVPLCGALLEAARTNRIPVEGIDPLIEADTIAPGDSVTALVNLCEKGPRQTQWLIHLVAVKPAPKELEENSPKTMVIYNSFGNKLEFLSAPAFVTVRVLGPFNASGGRSPKAQDRSARIVLNKGYLGLGLDQAVAAMFRMKQSKTFGPMASGTAPFSEEQISRGRQLAAALKITPAEERALGGSFPALLSYFSTVQETPGLQEILIKILDRPSLWSILRHGGINSVDFNWQLGQMGPAEAGAWDLAATSAAYYLPMVLKLNQHPSLRLTMVVAPPRPPLLACGGIVGVLAEKPGEKDAYLTLRVVSARRAAKQP